MRGRRSRGWCEEREGCGDKNEASKPWWPVVAAHASATTPLPNDLTKYRIPCIPAEQIALHSDNALVDETNYRLLPAAACWRAAVGALVR